MLMPIHYQAGRYRAEGVAGARLSALGYTRGRPDWARAGHAPLAKLLNQTAESAPSRETNVSYRMPHRGPIVVVSGREPAHGDAATGSPLAPQSRPQLRPIHRVIASHRRIATGELRLPHV